MDVRVRRTWSVLCFAICLVSAGLAGAQQCDYDLTVRCDPPNRSIEVDATVVVPGELVDKGKLTFILNEHFEIDEVSVDGAAAKARRSKKPQEVMFHIEVAEYRVPARGDGDSLEVRIRYHGTMPDGPEGAGGIGDHLVELALYRTWFPEFSGARGLSYAMTAHLPAGFLAAANGRPSSEPEERAGETVHRFENQTSSATDINLVASDEWQQIVLPVGAWEVEVLWTKMDPVQAAIVAQMAADAFELFTRRWGAAAGSGRITVAMVPRGGQSYSRIPLMVMNEEYMAREFEPDPTGCTATGVVHEIGHVWWNRGDTHTREDWLNESLAEYARWIYLEAFCGEQRVRADRRESASHATRIDDVSIADVDRNQRQAYTLYYVRGPRLYTMLEDLLGRAAVQRCLATFLAETEPRTATTDDLVAAFQQGAGYDLEPFLDDWYRSPRSPQVLVESWEMEDDEVVVELSMDAPGATPIPVEVEVVTSQATFHERVLLQEATSTHRIPVVGTVQGVDVNGDGRALVRNWDTVRDGYQWNLIGLMSNPRAERDPSSVSAEDLEKARSVIDELYERDPGDDIGRYWEGRWLFLQQRNEEAAELLEGLLANEEVVLRPLETGAATRLEDREMLFLELGRVYDVLGRRDEATELYRRIVEATHEAWCQKTAGILLERPYIWPEPLHREK